MSQSKKYWKGLEQLKSTPEFTKYTSKEFPDYLPLNENEGDPNRRDFLKLMGFGLAAVSLAACETPIKKAIPYVRKPVSVDPAIPNYYASTYISGSDYLPVVVKTREGRPIKIEGNKLSSWTGGGITAQVEASILSLYDKERLQKPSMDGKECTWADVDSSVQKIFSSGERVLLFTHTIASPSLIKAIEALTLKYPNIKWVSYDAISVSAKLDVHNDFFGKRVLPSTDFSKAKTIVSFGDDFLGYSPNQSVNNYQFAQTRKLSDSKKDMSRLYVFESNLTLTGSNADYRIPVKPSQQKAYLAALYNKVASKSGYSTINSPSIENEAIIGKIADELLINKGKSIVLSGSNDVESQKLTAAINHILENYGATLSIDSPYLGRNGNDVQLIESFKQINSSAGVIFLNCNPVYDHAMGSQIADALTSVKWSLSTSDRNDETSILTKIKAPDCHFLESWGDAEIIKGRFSLLQPTISKIFDTRQILESLLVWGGESMSAYDFVKKNWELSIFPYISSDYYNFDTFWQTSLQNGVLDIITKQESQVSSSINLSSEFSFLSESDLEVSFYTKSSIGTGELANNPWLQEMPDPISKVVWDNYLTVSPRQAEEWGIEIGDMTTQIVEVTINGQPQKLPVLVQPGQCYGTVGIALGYGRTVAGRVANSVGINAYPWITLQNGYSTYFSQNIAVVPTKEPYSLAQTQTTQTFMGRETVIQESTLSKYKEDPQAGRYFPKIATSEGYKKPYAISLWKGHEYSNHHWGMVVDLNSCTGCGSCTIACQVENNIPVVGKQEVLNRREMHWIRIDRYYSHSEEYVGEASGPIDALRRMEKAEEYPEVVFQPMMCQHCNNAPCETVCPVAATTHSSEGLNQMTYNRCIGTRYCANNCPYKVRRFNWFKYHDNDQFGNNIAMNNDLGKMVLNPDVTVRARGVIEKCSFCVQRIQYGKLEAKKEGRRPIDGEVISACASSCPSEALVFGDMKDPESRISKLLKIKENEKGVEAKEDRAYHVLEELRVMPNVWYLTKIRNKDEEKVDA